MAIHRVDRMKDSMKHFSQRALAQFGMVKKSSRSSGHESSHFILLPASPAAERCRRTTIRFRNTDTVLTVLIETINGRPSLLAKYPIEPLLNPL